MDPLLQLHLNEAVQAFQAGNLLKAEQLLKNYLLHKPKEFDAIHLLAIVYASQGIHMHAIKSYKKALKISPNNVSALSNLGSSLSAIGHGHEALIVLQMALDINPVDPDLWYNFANTLCDLGEHEKALGHYEHAVKLNPMHYQAFNNFGKALFDLKRYSESLIYFDKALEINRDFFECLINKGEALKNLKHHIEAFDCQKKIIEIYPAYHQVWSNLGVILNELKRYDEAIAHYDKALNLKSDCAQYWYNKGNTLNELKRYDEAIAHYDKALNLKSDFAICWYNKGNTLNELKRYDEAIAHYDRAIGLEPDNAEALYNRAIVSLTVGKFKEGWEDYEYRDRLKKPTICRKILFSQAPINLASLKNKRVLILPEQGLGDTIQFCRYLTLLKYLGAEVSFVSPKPLVNLLRSSLDGVHILEDENNYGEYDHQEFLLSLPKLFRTDINSIPVKNFYLRADAQKSQTWKNKLANITSPRIGLVWNGGFREGHADSWEYNERRNIPLKQIASLRTLRNLNFFSLQKGNPAELEIATKKSDMWPDINFYNYASELNDFSDTAALIDNLDLVISVDTSTAHLAAALGKPVWLLNRYNSCWRWLNGRTDSPWYPSLKLYNQECFGDWNSVLDKVKSDLYSLSSQSDDT